MRVAVDVDLPSGYIVTGFNSNDIQVLARQTVTIKNEVI